MGFVEDAFVLPTGQVWGLEHYYPSSTLDAICVSIPAGQVAGLTDAMIGQHVRAALIEAEKLSSDAGYDPESAPPRKPKGGFVYLMVDRRNGLYKIGWSTNPAVRETTLQSEQPFIDLLRYWPGTLEDERKLHTRFVENRVRGEWFRLSDDDVSQIEKEAQF